MQTGVSKFQRHRMRWHFGDQCLTAVKVTHESLAKIETQGECIWLTVHRGLCIRLLTLRRPLLEASRETC